MSPASRHQKTVQRIEGSIQPLPESSCGCSYLSDTYIRFPDGSLKRPDISIFCDEPPDSDEALPIVPAAIIEIISEGSEYKDLQINPPFYLSQGVLDVVVLNPHTGVILHTTPSATTTGHSPTTIALRCGCTCVV
jgi:Uma2 family endonuclease